MCRTVRIRGLTTDCTGLTLQRHDAGAMSRSHYVLLLLESQQNHRSGVMLSTYTSTVNRDVHRDICMQCSGGH